ncbi:MAG: hypothetical protein BRD50_03320 [Bacteroidetes bacterium SW_11_45_7]|nr:MAG: hypothetical protein BRD50_03320 [Bacteroidetes bacterium SW_11_45_7]
MEAFHAGRNNNNQEQHTAACDCFVRTLKGLINYVACQKSPLLVFGNLTVEWRLAMAQSDLKGNLTVPREEELKMQANHYSYITLDEGIRLFENMHPPKKHELKPYWQLLKTYQNQSKDRQNFQHSATIRDKLSFLTLDMLTFLIDEGILPPNSYQLTDQDQQFLRNEYPEQRVKRVEQALQNPEKYPVPFPVWPRDSWNIYHHQCPSCHSQAQLYGFTGIEVEGKQDFLTFYACSLACEHCQLRLWDLSELLIAGCANVFDLSHQLDQWLNDHRLFIPDNSTMPAK